MAAAALAREGTEEAFLDAAERLLVEVGYAGITTRRLAEEAGANPGLVHYYFGSMEELLAQSAGALHRAAGHAAARDVRLPRASWRSGARRWATWTRTAYQKIWWELQAMAWNRPEFRERVARSSPPGAPCARRSRRRCRATSSTMPLGAWVARRDHERGDHPRAALGHHARTRRAAGMDRRLARGPRSAHDVKRGTGRHARRQMRAREPDEAGYVERNGARIGYEVFGDGEPTICCCRPGRSSTRATGRRRSPTSRGTSACSPSTARATDVGPAARSARYSEREFAADTLAVMDATGTERAVLVALSAARSGRSLLAADHPERVLGIVSSAPTLPFARHPARPRQPVQRAARTTRAGPSTTATTGSSDYRGFLEFFFGRCFTEPHSTKQIEDCVGWGLETDAGDDRCSPRRPRSARLGRRARSAPRSLPGARACTATRTWSVRTTAAQLARATGGALVTLRAPGTPARTRPGPGQPAAARVRAPAPPPRGGSRWPRRRAQARALRVVADRPRARAARRRDRAGAARAAPGPRDRLARAAPGHRVLEAEGERIHPASAHLANESRHME